MTSAGKRNFNVWLVAALLGALAGRNVLAQTKKVEPAPVTAIDILLEPDSTMLAHCTTNNARLLAVYPQGFALDSMHRPHVTLLQCFVRTADLEKVYAAEEQVFSGTN